MQRPLRLGIAGLGTVGAAVLRLLAQNGRLLAERAGREISVTAVWRASAGATGASI